MSTSRPAALLTLLLLCLSLTMPARSQLMAGPGGTRSPTPRSRTGKLLSNPFCYQPDPAGDACIINVRYYSATDNGTSGPYMSRPPDADPGATAQWATCTSTTVLTVWSSVTHSSLRAVSRETNAPESAAPVFTLTGTPPTLTCGTTGVV